MTVKIDGKRILRVTLLTLGVFALAVGLPILLWGLGGGPGEVAAVAAGLIASALALLATMTAKAARRQGEKISADLDVVSQRLVKLESRTAELVRVATDQTRRGPSEADLRPAVAELTGEIAMLGGIVKELAVTLAAHEEDIGGVRDSLDQQKDSLDRQLAGVRDTMEEVARAVAAVSAAARGTARQVPQGHAAASPPARGPEPDPAPAAPFPPAPRAEPRLTSPLPPPSVPRGAMQPPPPPSILAPEPADPPEAVSPADRAEARRAAAILDAFQADRVEIHLQAVVTLPQRKVRFYEALARLRLHDDELLVPAEFMPVLDRTGLAPDLDAKVLARAAAVARHLVERNSDAFVSCNLSPAALVRPGFLRALGRVVESYPDVAGRLVFEISQRCWRTLDAETAGGLSALRAKGVGFALDRASDLRLDPLALSDRGVRFVKIPCDLLLAAQRDVQPDIAVADLAAVLSRAGIRLVAEKVEGEETVPDLLDLDVPLAQGFVFSGPRAVRSEVFAGAAPPPGPRPAQGSAPQMPASQMPAPQMPAAPSEDTSTGGRILKAGETLAQRMPFRSFLRRAG